MLWNINDTITATTKSNLEFKYTEKLACFDLDNTLIKTKSGKKFAINEYDFEFFSVNVIKKLNYLYNNGFCIVIITNQAGLNNKKKITDWENKIDKLITEIKLPIKLFASISHDIYRKPLPSFIINICKELETLKLQLSNESFYCGDACGRLDDFNDTDYKFALNTGLKFITPNELFDKKKVIIPQIIYPPFKEIAELSKVNDIIFKPHNKEMILMVGYPGSGKSTFVSNVLIPLNYVRINRDTLKTATKCLNEARKNLIDQKSVVIDNTNYDIKSREKYIQLANQFNYHIRCIIIDVSIDLAKHNAIYRFFKNEDIYIPDIVYKKYKKNYVEPSLTEGINEIIKIKPKIIVKNNDYTKLYMY